MPDATGGVASGVYWVITGRLPGEELAEDDDLKAKPEDDEEDPKKKP